ncbi:intermembrane phospholipid transport protein YdbH family protein [Thiomicrorhabdus sp.]|uniref:intermembrane phospholipid transport protein YdbH family protein n=1 Tax=Thiomicrorhabdus sp. TaxID=2039724 RepID=UPI002AA629E2|nr:YdbH domain-containing protein [Thiomicrorhabdus sp.]
MPIALLAIVITASLYLINQQLTEQKISNYSWQFDEIKDRSLNFKNIDFTFNNQLDIQLENIHFSSSESDSKNDIFPYLTLSKVEIGIVKINILNSQQNQTKVDTKHSIDKTIENLKRQLQNIQNKPEWFAFLPKKINITSFIVQAPCPQSSCSVKGSADLKIINTHTDIQAQGHLNFHDQEIASPQLETRLLIKIPSNIKSHNVANESNANTSNNAYTGLEYKIDSELKAVNSNANLMQFSQAGKITEKQKLPVLSVHNHFSGLLPGKNNTIDKEWQNIQAIYQNWIGQPLELDHLNQYLPVKTPHVSALESQESANSNSDFASDFEVKTNTTIQLDSLVDSLTSIKTETTIAELLNTIAFSNEIKAQFNAPFPIPSIGSIQGSIKANLAFKNGMIQSYDLDANGFFHRSLPIALFDNQQIKPFQDFKFLASSSQKQVTEIDKLNSLPFKLSINSINSINSKNATDAVAKLQAEGVVQLSKTPELNINSGLLNFSQVNLALTNQKLLNELSGEIQLNGKLDVSNINLQIPKFNVTGVYSDKDQNLVLSKMQINTNNLILNSKPALFLDEIQASAKSINIKADLNYSPKDKQQILMKNIDLVLSNPKLAPKFDAKNPNNTDHVNKLNTKQFTAKYILKTDRVEQQNLQPLAWTLRGKIQSQLPNTLSSINQLNIQGSVSNKAGLVVFHNAFYKPNNLYTDWEIPNIYLLAGNPIQKTFKDWPKLLTLGSGQLKAKGNTQLNLSSLNDNTNLLNILYTKAEIDTKGISGIYNETTLNQVSSKINLSLNHGVLKTEFNNLEIKQINHGLIFGPTVFNGNYQTSIDSWLQGKLKLTQFNTKLFNGQAWLDNQTFDLSQPINSQLHLSQIDIKALLEQYPSAEIKGSGIIHGNLPFSLNLQEQPFFTLDKGAIKAKSPGGLIQYKAAPSIKQTHQSMQFVFTVLEDFHYSVLDSNVTYDANKTLHLTLHLQGKNPNVENGRQVNFNINLEEDLPALITTMQLSNQVSETIKKRIQEKLQQ